MTVSTCVSVIGVGVILVTGGSEGVTTYVEDTVPWF